MDIKSRVAELAVAAGVDLTTERVSADRCWVDGRVHCPYGSPEGQYRLRPAGYCHDVVAQGDGCLIYHDHVADEELTESLRTDAVREHFEAHKTDVTGELRARADELAPDSVEQLSLKLAADVIEERKLNRNILLEEDLPQ